jgi:hypothetical protein
MACLKGGVTQTSEDVGKEREVRCLISVSIRISPRKRLN